ncbi:saccharopine dehydrogenase family protein [Flagellimonas nanhaiensis]|uniref:Saccharopine dehydrogenase n=1 Tax=Flagellimonas nanhaiensis TaxID=2292706 RepID=A0A371JN24_9FLAO|nr:saccharopine dehydrogenase C-terminal domain-containing protein [Allomuricauda nanhaiensis]RDY58608.1 saccharopine dehydrogenase [Allomuricauda nanhaiensis]
MNRHFNIVIAGAGGIAQAVGLILAQWSKVSPTLYIGNRTLSKAEDMAQWIKNGSSRSCIIETFEMSEGINPGMEAVFKKGDILLDCLPGSLAPTMAKYARDYNMHYANLTEYVDETNQIMELARGADTGFVLQTGLAPGYINVLAHYLFQEFCNDFEVDTVERLKFRVGALTDHAIPPHFYGFTWSPVGVATEYIKDAVALRKYQKTILPSLSEQATLILDGITYEEDLTSGGVADLPDALAGRVGSLDYKTLRYPGHYDWVKDKIKGMENKENLIPWLQDQMEKVVPHTENDQVVLYASVESRDKTSVLRRREVSKRIFPQKVGTHRLRAIQITTAAPLLQSAQLLLESNIKGVVLQSQINPKVFLEGNYITAVYGNV